MDDLWHTRDLPVLQFVVETLQHPDNAFRGGVRGSAIASATGLDVTSVAMSLALLEDEGYIECTRVLAGPGAWRASKVYGRALREVGAWPTPESMADRILAELQKAIDEAPDEPTRSKLRSAMAVLGQGVVDTGTNLLAAVIAKSIGQV